ncbi:MAG TPA: hypothetical protein VLH10_07870 [Yinghuangia sp.]|nr:hypothetical protein [Yinghuangia sp.]
MDRADLPLGVPLSSDIEYRPEFHNAYRARVRWVAPGTFRRQSRSESFPTEEEARA